MPDYQVSVIYNSKKLIPAPFVSLTRDIQRSPDGTAHLRTWKVVVKGKLSAIMGSPDNSGTYWTTSGYPPDPDPSEQAASLRIRNLKNKMGAMTNLFAEDGHWFEIQPGDGSAPIKFLPRINELDFQEGKWFDYADYTIQMETDCVHFGTLPDSLCEFTAEDNPPEESWTVEPADDFRPTYRLTHNVSAIGKNRFNEDGSGEIETYGWELAKAVVDNVLGFSTSIVEDTFGIDGMTGYNHTMRKEADKSAGRYAVNETWILSSNNYTEDTTVDTGYSSETGIFTVRVSGNIVGLQTGEDTTTRYTNAKAYADTILTPDNRLIVAEAESGVTLNPNPISTTVARNQPQGVVNYSIEFNTRPAITDGYLSENITISLDSAVPVVAEIGVVNRGAGPIFQPIGSYTKNVATVQADILVPVAYGQAFPTKPSFDPLAAVLEEITPSIIYVESDRLSWSKRSGRYSRSTAFKWE